MSEKVYYTEGERPASQMGAALESLFAIIEERRGAGEKSYTYRLLNGSPDTVLKKVMEEAGEVALAAKDVEAASTGAGGADGAAARDAAVDHLRYEAGDVVYHLLVALARYGVTLDEFAAELNSRMTEDAIALRHGVAMIKPEYVKRGK